MRNYIDKLFAGILLTLMVATPAEAVLVEVGWSASIPGTATPAPGPGQLSGSLGVFNVTAVGDTFLLPSDGSLTAVASGFADGFPNGIYPFTRTHSQGAPELQFLSIGTSPSDFSVNFIDNNTGLLSPFPNACVVDGLAGNCFVGLFDENTSGIDKAFASLGIDGSLADTNLAAIEYSFTVVPIPPAVWLFGSGLLGLVGIARRKKAA
jgi:hypothetical protein